MLLIDIPRLNLFFFGALFSFVPNGRELDLPLFVCLLFISSGSELGLSWLTGVVSLSPTVSSPSDRSNPNLRASTSGFLLSTGRIELTVPRRGSRLDLVLGSSSWATSINLGNSATEYLSDLLARYDELPVPFPVFGPLFWLLRLRAEGG